MTERPTPSPSDRKAEPLQIAEGLDHLIPIHFLIEQGLFTYTEIKDRLNIMDVERFIHIHLQREDQRHRTREANPR